MIPILSNSKTFTQPYLDVRNLGIKMVRKKLRKCHTLLLTARRSSDKQISECLRSAKLFESTSFRGVLPSEDTMRKFAHTCDQTLKYKCTEGRVKVAYF